MKRSSRSRCRSTPPARRKRSLSEEERALVGECCQANQTAAKKSRIREAASAIRDTGEPAGHVQPRCAEFAAIAAGQDLPTEPPPLAPLGTPGTRAIVARAEADRCQARSARHDPDPRPSRAVRLPASRPSRRPDVRAGHHRQGQNAERSPSAACCAGRCRNGFRCRNSVRWWSVLMRPMSAMVARARSTCGSGAHGFRMAVRCRPLESASRSSREALLFYRLPKQTPEASSSATSLPHEGSGTCRRPSSKPIANSRTRSQT